MMTTMLRNRKTAERKKEQTGVADILIEEVELGRSCVKWSRWSIRVTRKGQARQLRIAEEGYLQAQDAVG